MKKTMTSKKGAKEKMTKTNKFDQARSKKRSVKLLKLLDTNQVKKRLEVLLNATKGNGQDLKFLNRWGYSNEQINAITESIYEVAK